MGSERPTVRKRPLKGLPIRCECCEAVVKYRPAPPAILCDICRGVPTITIPVAEYQQLVKRAKFYEAVEDWEEIASKLWDSDPLCQALRAAIKEQEG